MEQDITIYLAKAEESLRTAESEFANGRYNSCANRCYYACFQAAIAALLAEGIRARGQWSHEFVQGQFVGVLINCVFHGKAATPCRENGTPYDAGETLSVSYAFLTL